MIKFAIKILLVGLVLLLGYYFFLGSPEDKERAKAVFAEVGDLFGELGNFIKGEHAKFDRGDYKDELEKIRELIEDVKARAADLSSFQQSAEETQALLLERKRDALKRLAEKEDLTEEEIAQLERELIELKKDANDLATSEGSPELPKLL